MTKFFNQFIYILIIIFNSIYYVESMGGMGRGGIGGGGGRPSHIGKRGGNHKMTNTYNPKMFNTDNPKMTLTENISYYEYSFFMYSLAFIFCLIILQY